MIPYPLTKLNRVRLGRAFAAVPHVDISVECALEDQMGAAYADQPDAPGVFLIEQNGFFCYLAGDAQSDADRAMAQNLPAGRLLMAWSPGWADVLTSLYGDRIIPIERYLYESHSLSLAHVSGLLDASPLRDRIHRLDVDRVQAASEPFVSIGDFESPEDFVARGIGFVYVEDGEVVGGAYSSLVSSRSIEVSIFVHDDHRRKGAATALSAALLKWCLSHHIEPHWDASNEESCKLAEKLGYVAAGTYTAYYLKPASN